MRLGKELVNWYVLAKYVTPSTAAIVIPRKTPVTRLTTVQVATDSESPTAPSGVASSDLASTASGISRAVISRHPKRQSASFPEGFPSLRDRHDLLFLKA